VNEWTAVAILRRPFAPNVPAHDQSDQGSGCFGAARVLGAASGAGPLGFESVHAHEPQPDLIDMDRSAIDDICGPPVHVSARTEIGSNRRQEDDDESRAGWKQEINGLHETLFGRSQSKEKVRKI
jgi:hypothetical protein